MLNAAHADFAEAFAAEATTEDAQDRVLENVTADLTAGNCEVLEKPCTLAELTDAMRKVKSNTSPGPNGLPMRFFRVLWEVIGPILVDIKNESMLTGKLSKAQSRRNIVLLPKEGDARLLTQKRPISLMDCDTRILSKVDATRLGPHICDLIGKEQVGFMPGRWIGDPIETMQTLFDSPRDGIVVSTDLVKAYDRQSHDWIRKVMEHMGFGCMALNAYEALYANGTASVVLNGFLSPRFNIERGVPQGGAMACFLFNIALEPLACMIRHERDGLTGILLKPVDPPAANSYAQLRISQPQQKQRPFRRAEDEDGSGSTLQVAGSAPPVVFATRKSTVREPRAYYFVVQLFADDVAVGCKDLAEVDKLEGILSVYSRASGAQLNMRKSFLAPLHRTRDEFKAHKPPRRQYREWRIEVEPFRYLGVPCGIGVDRDQVWAKLTAKVAQRLRGMMTKDLPLFVQARCMNKYVFSMVLFLMNFCPPTEAQMRTIQDLVEDKIYSGQRPRKCYSALHTPREMGGLGLVHLQRHVLPALAHWVGRLFEDSESKPQYVCLRAELNRGQMSPIHNAFGQLSWPMAFAWINNIANVGGGNRCGGMPWRWQQYRNAFYALAKEFQSETGKMMTKHLKQLCHERYREDPTLPFDLHEVIKVELPHQLETIGFFTSSFQKRIAKDTSKLILPAWSHRYANLGAEKRWKALWPRVKSLPLNFAPLLQSWYFVAYRAHRIGMDGWPKNKFNNDPDCKLCGKETETYDHLYTECSVAIQLWQRGIDLDSSPPLFPALIAPKPRRHNNKFVVEDIKAVLHIGAISKLARSRRASDDVLAYPPPEHLLQPIAAKSRRLMRYGMHIINARPPPRERARVQAPVRAIAPPAPPPASAPTAVNNNNITNSARPAHGVAHAAAPRATA
jgi:hypothetical protein